MTLKNRSFQYDQTNETDKHVHYINVILFAIILLINELNGSKFMTHPVFFCSQFKRLNVLYFIAFAGLFLPSFELTAKQLTFNKIQQDSHYLFSYQWLDHQKETQAIQFELSAQGLFDRFRDFKSYQANYAQKTILRNMKRQLTKQPLEGVQVLYNRTHGDISIEVRGQDESKVALAYQEIAKLEQAVSKKYYDSIFYHQFSNHDQISAIKVNHAAIANASVSDLKVLKPLILEKVSIKNIRKVTNYVLGFVQNIPYSTLENRMTSSGAGFNPPLKLLWENQGDCDSKMTLTVSILRALMPRIEMALIYIDNHAFIGISIPARAGEMTINHQGSNYVLGDPTGPTLLPLGKLSTDSELAIHQGLYTVENFHEVINND